jgi:hypothetical protein
VELLGTMQVLPCMSRFLQLEGVPVGLVPYSLLKPWPQFRYISAKVWEEKYTFLGLLAKIKCSICSYQFNI